MGLFKRPSSSDVTPDSLQSALADGALLVDVRTPEEWAAGHLDVASHIPLDELEQRLSELDPARLTIFLCRSGHRSEAATTALGARGYAVANLDGGMNACARAGLPVVRDGGAPGEVI